MFALKDQMFVPRRSARILARVDSLITPEKHARETLDVPETPNKRKRETLDVPETPKKRRRQSSFDVIMHELNQVSVDLCKLANENEQIKAVKNITQQLLVVSKTKEFHSKLYEMLKTFEILNDNIEIFKTIYDNKHIKFNYDILIRTFYVRSEILLEQLDKTTCACNIKKKLISAVIISQEHYYQLRHKRFNE